MFPRNTVLRLGRYEVAVRYLPAAERLGGDWYDARFAADGSALVVIGDVAGHGLPAAAGMVRICSALRGLSVTGLPANWLLCYLNRLICSDECPEQVASAVVCVLDQECPALLWAQAGHPPPMLISAGSARLLNPPRGQLLGVDPAAGYSLGCEEVMAGDIVLLYTDGLIERRGQDIADGLDALLAAAAGSPPSTAAEAADAILTRLAPPPADDICLVAIQVGR
jgi:serine phosphatase RsbU (regulator of sigma subunit)